VDLFLTDAGRDVAARCAEIPAQIVAELGLEMGEVRQSAAMMRDLRARLADQDGDLSPGISRA